MRPVSQVSQSKSDRVSRMIGTRDRSLGILIRSAIVGAQTGNTRCSINSVTLRPGQCPVPTRIQASMPSRRGSTRSIVASTCTRAPGNTSAKRCRRQNQPACGEHRGDRDRDHLGIAFLDECKTAFDLVEASREVGTELRACCRRHHTACLSAEQHATEAGFQLPDLLGHGTGCHPQLVGGTPQGTQARDRFCGSKCSEMLVECHTLKFS